MNRNAGNTISKVSQPHNKSHFLLLAIIVGSLFTLMPTIRVYGSEPQTVRKEPPSSAESKHDTPQQVTPDANPSRTGNGAVSIESKMRDKGCSSPSLTKPSSTANENGTPAIETIGQTNVTAHAEDNAARDAWLHFFGALAETIGVGATLLLALVVVRLEIFTHTFTTIEHSIAEVFHALDENDKYLSQVSDHFLNNRWKEYLDGVESLAITCRERFSPDGRYTESISYVNSLILRGRKLSAHMHELQGDLQRASTATVILAGSAIVAIPAGIWASLSHLYIAWVVSTILLIGIFTIFLRVLFSSFKCK